MFSSEPSVYQFLLVFWVVPRAFSVVYMWLLGSGLLLGGCYSFLIEYKVFWNIFLEQYGGCYGIWAVARAVSVFWNVFRYLRCSKLLLVNSV